MMSAQRSGAVIGAAVWLYGALAASGQTPVKDRTITGACTDYAVGAPRRLVDAQGRRIYVDSPTLTKVGNGIALLGSQTLLWRSQAVFADTAGMIEEAKAGRYVNMDTLAGAVLDSRGMAETIGKPGNIGKVHAVAAVPDGRDGAWVAWLTGPDTAIHPKDVWIAHLRAGKWDGLEHPVHVANIYPNSISISAVIPGSAPIIAFGGSDVNTIGGLGIARRDANGWKSLWLNEVWPPDHTEIIRQDDHRLTVAFIGYSAPPRSLDDSNRVFVTQSSDDGKTWSVRRVVDSNQNTSANWLQLTATDATRLHMIWMVTRQGSAEHTIIHVVSSDGGATWHRAERQTHPQLRAVSAIPTKEGLTYIAQYFAEETLALVDLRTNEPPAVFPLPWQRAALPEGATTLGELSGPILITWGERVQNAYPLYPFVGAPATLFAWLTPCRQSK